MSCSVSGASTVGLTASGDASWDPSVGSREDGVGGVIDSCAIGHVARDITQRCPQLRRPGRLFCAASWRPAAPPVAFAAALPVWRAATVIAQLCYECAFGRLYRQPTSPLHHQLHHQLHFQPRCCLQGSGYAVEAGRLLRAASCTAILAVYDAQHVATWRGP